MLTYSFKERQDKFEVITAQNIVARESNIYIHGIKQIVLQSVDALMKCKFLNLPAKQKVS